MSMRFPCHHGKDDAGEEHSICRDEKCFLGWFLKYAIADLPPDDVAVVALERSITQMNRFGGNLWAAVHRDKLSAYREKCMEIGKPEKQVKLRNIHTRLGYMSPYLLTAAKEKEIMTVMAREEKGRSLDDSECG